MGERWRLRPEPGNWFLLWNATTGKLICQLNPKVVRLTFSVAFALDAPLFTSGGTDGICVWNTDTWMPVANLGPGSSFYEIAFSRSAHHDWRRAAPVVHNDGDAGNCTLLRIRETRINHSTLIRSRASTSPLPVKRLP